MAQTSVMVDELKKALREAGVSYAQVAQGLGLSEASVKRLFSQRQFTMERFEACCDMAGLGLGDLIRRVESAQYIGGLSWQQETELVSDPKLLVVATSAINRWSYDEILATYEIQDSELIRYLAWLDRMHLIEFLPGNRIKPLITSDFSWQKGGPIQQYFEAQVQSDFFQCRFDRPGELRLFVTGMLSPQSNERVQRRMQRLAQEFRHAHQEDLNEPLHNRYGTSMVMAMRPWELDVFRKMRRPGKEKVYSNHKAKG